MKVELKDGSIIEVNDSYGARLFEQGKAVVAKAPAKARAGAEAEGAKPGKSAGKTADAPARKEKGE